jgi:hypothetical protein
LIIDRDFNATGDIPASITIVLTSWLDGYGATTSPIASYAATTGLAAPTFTVTVSAPSTAGIVSVNFTLGNGTLNFEKASRFFFTIILVDAMNMTSTYANVPLFIGNVGEPPSVPAGLPVGGTGIALPVTTLALAATGTLIPGGALIP